MSAEDAEHNPARETAPTDQVPDFESAALAVQNCLARCKISLAKVDIFCGTAISLQFSEAEKVSVSSNPLDLLTKLAHAGCTRRSTTIFFVIRNKGVLVSLLGSPIAKRNLNGDAVLSQPETEKKCLESEVRIHFNRNTKSNRFVFRYRETIIPTSRSFWQS